MQTTTKPRPDEIPDEIYREAANLRAENSILKDIHSLLQAREEEAGYIRNSDLFLAGYKMAMHDILSRSFNVDADLDQDMDTTDWGDGVPF